MYNICSMKELYILQYYAYETKWRVRLRVVAEGMGHNGS